MPKENLIPKTETVQELKEESKIPSFEEFMKTYENDGNLNYDDLSSVSVGEVKGYGPMYHRQYQLQKLQVQKQMSVQEKKAIYDLFCASIERLEKYIEINYKKEFPDWENRKQIRTNNFKIENPHQYSERFESGIRNQLRLTNEMLVNYTTSEFREELKQEYCKWIKAVGININNCPEKLKYFLFGISEILEGREKLERETEIHSNSFEHDEVLRMFSRLQAPLGNEGNVEFLRGKIYRDERVEENFQQLNNYQIIQDIKNNPQDWRLDEIPTEIDSFGRIKEQERLLIHRSAQENDFDSEGKLNFNNNPIYRDSRFNQAEIKEINKVLNISRSYLSDKESCEILYSREQKQTNWQIAESFYQEEPVASTYTKYQGAVESGRSIRINKKTRIKGFQHLIHTGNDWADKNNGPNTARGELWDKEEAGYSNGSFRFSSFTTSVGANAGMGGLIASGGAGYSVFGIKDGSSGESKFLSASIGGEIGAGPGGVVAGYSLGANVVSVQGGGFSANVGVDVGSGVSFGVGGVEAKVGGIGISIGKKMGFSTPFGGISVDLEEACVVQ